MIKVLTYLSVAVALSACSTSRPPEYQVRVIAANNPQVTIETTSDLPNCRGSNASTWTNCFGTFTYANGSKYVGEFKDGKMNGQGTYNFANGDKYVGNS